MDKKKYNAIRRNTMVDFAKLKKASGGLDRLAKELDKLNAPASQEKKEDDRFWKIERDKSGNGSAVIRFLPAPAVDGDDALPWVRIFDHGFKGPSGKWYIEKSLTTLGQKDPVSEFNTKLWNAGGEGSPERKQAQNQKRRLSYISNIYVVSDPKHPENEGKVFLFKFGKKIFDKITMLMKPEFEDDTPINPFDLWKGANFKIRIRTVDGYANYDQSLFESSTPLSQEDDELEKIWKSEYSLKEFVDPSQFKSYAELKAKLEMVLGEVSEAPVERPAPAARKETKAEAPSFDIDEDDDDLKAFKALADD